MLRKLVYSLTELNDREVSNGEIAEACGLSEAMISQFFNEERELSFSHIISICRKFNPGKEAEIVGRVSDFYIEQESRMSCRMMMEYASLNRDFKLLEKVIKSQMSADSRENKDWSKLYSIVIQFQKRSIPPEEVVVKLEQYSPKHQETKAMHKIMLSAANYWSGDYKAMNRHALASEKLVEKIKSDYIRECYTARVCEMFALMYLYVRADVKKARHYANNVINSAVICDNFKSHLYHLLGTSFLFEDFGRAVSYFEIYKGSLESQGRFELANEVMKKDIFFAKVLWGVNVEECETDDVLEQNFLRAKEGKPLNATSEDNPFAVCYEGISKQCGETLMRSAAMFVNSGNKFFSKLPMDELRKHSTFSVIAETLLQNLSIA